MPTRLAAILLVYAFGLAVASQIDAAGAGEYARHPFVTNDRGVEANLVSYRQYRDEDEDEDEDEGELYYEAPRRYLPAQLPPLAPVYRRPWPPAAEYGSPSYEWLPPPRPASCGVFRYWDGERCADARYFPPYIGPRW